MIKRVGTGVGGLDDLLEGGFIPKTNVVITGTPGTGKTIFGLQYLNYGATECNENGLYVTFEEKLDSLRRTGSCFGWDIPDLEKKGKITLLKVPSLSNERVDRNDTSDELGYGMSKVSALPSERVNVFAMIQNAAEKANASRVVIDSISLMSIVSAAYEMAVLAKPVEQMFSNKEGKVIKYSLQSTLMEMDIQRFVYGFIERLNDLGTTNVLITDSSPNEEGYLTRDHVSEFAADCVIRFKAVRTGVQEATRSLEIIKMRQTKHGMGVYPLEIGKNGIRTVDKSDRT